MSRLSRYQTSIRKFICDKSSLSTCLYKEPIIELIQESDFILPITLLTVMKNIPTKHRSLEPSHGYDMATGIELLNCLLSIAESNKTFKDKDILLLIIPPLINLTLITNINNLIQNTKDEHYKIILNINKYAFIQLNEKIIQLIIQMNTGKQVLMENILDKSPPYNLSKFHFKNSKKKSKIQKIKIISNDKLLNHIDNTMGTLSKITLILGWILGGGDHKMIPSLERLGIHLSLLLKISNDFNNLEKDIDTAIENCVSTNYVINVGITNAYELFNDSKEKFNEGILLLDLYTPTIKEFIDVLEERVDQAIEQSSPDLKSIS